MSNKSGFIFVKHDKLNNELNILFDLLSSSVNLLSLSADELSFV